MEKYISAIEISDTQVRLAVGYEKEGKVNLIHISERPITGLISRGEIVDFQTLSTIIASMKEFKDDTTKEKISINEVTVVLPSLGLNVYQSTKTTNVVSPFSLIANIDIENVISLILKESLPGDSKIIEIVPDSFITEMGRSFVNPPINEKSNNITIKAKIHTLPSRVVNDYIRVIEGARLKIRRLCVSSYAIAELAKNDKEIPQSYILVDIGAGVTNLSLIGNCTPFETVSFTTGASDLIKKISLQMNLSYDDAFELLKRYGLDERLLTYKPAIATSIKDGVERQHDPESLNNLIKDFFNEYFKQFGVAFDTLMKGYPDNVRNLPLVFAGGMTKMFGFETLVKEQFSSNASLHYLEPLCLGARDTRFCAVIGAIFASSKYKGTLSDMRPKTTQLQRVRDNNAQ